MNNWKLIIATVVIFGTGVITGGLLVNYGKQHLYSATSVPIAAVTVATNTVTRTNNPPIAAPSLPEILSKPFLSKLDGLLHLNPDQRKAIEKILSAGQSQMKKVMSDARNDIRNQLNGEQKKQFDGLMKSSPKKSSPATNAPAASALENVKKAAEVLATNPVTCIVPTNSVLTATNAP